MTTANIYLNFRGNCEEAFSFYQSVLGGEIPYVSRYKDIPAEDGNSPNLADAQKILHISLPVSNETVLMGSDVVGEHAAGFIEGNNFSISINTGSREKADLIFNGLSKGGKVTMPMNETFWGAYFGMLTDRFGINWMVSFDLKNAKG
ncbi:MAG TPA: VOC family protein [Bacteroidales bacterium]|nr:VOC family protein [Bacteroidales bacterium]